MTQPKEYNFPEKNPFEAYDVTHPNFDIRDFWDALFVDLDAVRGTEFWDEFKFPLRIQNDVLDSRAAAQKFIFSGHRGCGKTIELRRFHQYIHSPERYFSVMIELENEFEYEKFLPQDFYVLLISALAERLIQAGIDVDSEELDALVGDWFREDEIVQEVNETSKLSTENAASFGGSIWQLFTLKSTIKQLFSADTATSRKIREKIRSSGTQLISRLNLVIEDIRQRIAELGQGKDLLIIFDGTEKIKEDVYHTLFISDAHMIRQLNVHLIASVPISSSYNILHQATANQYNQVMLPMIQITKESRPYLNQIITRRIDESTFFTSAALKHAVDMSGGCPRQLLKVVNMSLTNSTGNKITKSHVETAVAKQGQLMRDALTTDAFEVLRSKDWDGADAVVLDLLLSLALLKYNGKRKINPMLKPFIK